MYYRLIGQAALEQVDFVEACDRIMFLDDWFPTIARIIGVTDECAKERRVRERQAERLSARPGLVCPHCYGARWVRLGGYDAGLPAVGKDGRVIHGPDSRMQHCPHCTTGGGYDVLRERGVIAREGGVPNPNAEKHVDLTQITWPARMDELRDPLTGKIDMDALYRLSRELRGLEPTGDDRIKPVAGWKTVAAVVRELDEVA
jgi:hypothetical protein